MQVKGISAPVEARRSTYGARFFLANSRDVASFTHDVDNPTRTTVEASAWVAVPFGRDVLIAAGVSAQFVSCDEVAAMSDDELREWVMGEYLYQGAHQAKQVMWSDAYLSGYPEDSGMALFLRTVTARVDEAFSFDADAAPVPVPRPNSRPAPSAARTLAHTS